MTEIPIAQKNSTEKPFASRKSDCQGVERNVLPHRLHTSPAAVHHTEAVFSIVREIYGREHDDPMDDLDVNMASWCIFLNATLRAAVHLGQDCEADIRYVKNHLWNCVRQLFNEIGKLIGEQTEITVVNTTKFEDSTSMSTSFLCIQAYQYTNAKAYVSSDSVFCVKNVR